MIPTYVWFAVLAAFTASCYSLTAKIIVRYRICNASLITWGMGLGVAAASGILWLFLRPPFPTAALLPLLGLTVSILLANWLLNLALQEGDASTVTPLMGTKIPMIALLAFLIFDETHSPVTYLAVILAAAAVALFALGPQQRAQGGHGRHPLIAVTYACLSALCYCFCDICGKFALTTAGPVTLALYANMLAGIVCLLMVFKPSYRIYRIALPDVALFLLSGIFFTATITSFLQAIDQAGGVTVPNIIFAVRGFIILVIGYLLNRTLRIPIERQPGVVYLLRTLGTIILFVAILIVLLG